MRHTNHVTRRLGLGSVAALAVLCAGAASAQEAPPRRRVFPVPVLGYTPETSLFLGLAVVGVTSPGGSGPATRPSTGLVTAMYTLKRQYSVSFYGDRWTTGDRWHLTFETWLSRFPSYYHGLGAVATDTSETYTPQTLAFTAAAQRRVAPHLFAGVGYAIRRQRLVEMAPGGRLAPGTVAGSRGGTSTGLSVDGVWDTRDVIYRTQRGVYARLALGTSGGALGGSYAYRRLNADVRGYRAVRRGVVLAAQAVVDAVDGTVPFELLPKLGGQNVLRGFTEPRFRDDAMAAAHVEVRAPLRGIVSLAAFVGAGAVAPSVGDLAAARKRVAGGLGLRFLLDRNEGLQLRVDYAVARGAGGLYVAAGDAF